MPDTLVTGASGRVGSAVVDELRTRGARVRAAARDPRRLPERAGVERTRLDLTDPASYPEALAGVRSLFLYAVPTGAPAFVAAAKAAGVEHVVLLSSHSQYEVATIPERKPIAEMHDAVETLVREAELPHTFLQPANFASNVLLWNWHRMIREDGVVRFPYPRSHSDAVHEQDIAEVAALALTEPGHTGRSYFVSGPESITQEEQAAAIAAATGRPVRFEELTPEAAREHLAGEIPPWVLDATFAWWAATDGVPAEVSTVVPEVLGRPARSFRQWAEDHVESFR